MKIELKYHNEKDVKRRQWWWSLLQLQASITDACEICEVYTVQNICFIFANNCWAAASDFQQ